MPESPRYLAQVRGEHDRAAGELEHFSEGVIAEPSQTGFVSKRMRLGTFLTDPQMLKLLLGTAGAWFLFDYAYYGNTLSLPAILKEVDATASLETKLLWSLGMFVIFAVPGYYRGQANGSHWPPRPAIHRVLGHGFLFLPARRSFPSSPRRWRRFLPSWD